MSDSQLSRKDLLQLSKVQLVKKCKKNKLNYNGSKSDMTNRLLKLNASNKKSINDEKNKYVAKSRRQLKKLKKKNKKKHTPKLLSRAAANFLVNGYIRVIESLLSTIVPTVINVMCLEYLVIGNIFVEIKHSVNIQLAKLNKLHHPITFDYYKTEIKHLDKSVVGNYTLRQDTSVCCGTNITLPPKIHKEMKILKPTYDIIFACGGRCWTSNTTNESNAFIIGDNYNSGIHAIYSWQLPELPTSMCDSCIIYNNKHGLICIGGQYQTEQKVKVLKSIYALSFNSAGYLKQDFMSSYFKKLWKWNKLTSMSERLVGTSAVVINNDSTLVVVGGKDTALRRHGWGDEYYVKNTVSMFEFESNKWKSLANIKFARSHAGICYNEYLNSIFIAGGSTECRNCRSAVLTIERYDIVQNRWYKIATIKQNQYYHNRPSLWTENNNLLYIAGRDIERIEQIDLRTHSVVQLYTQNVRYASPSAKYSLRLC